MAQCFTSGPALIFTGTQQTFQPEFLGTSEFSPYIDISPAFKPVFNDLGGRLIPFDKTFQGEEAFVYYNLTRWNEDVYARCAARPRPTGTRGKSVAGDIGALMNQQNLAYPIWVKFPYANDPAFAPDMPQGYHFLNAWLEGPDHMEPLGTEARALRIFFYCSRFFNVNDGSFTCYDNDMAAVAAFPNPPN